MQLIRALFASALLFTLVPAHADQAASVQRLTGLLQKAETLTGRFSQLSLDGTGTQLQETSGELALKRPGQFRWPTDAPMEQLLVSNGKKVWLYDPDLMQVTIQTLDQRLTHTPALLLSGDVSTLTDNFSIRWTQGGSVDDFVLTPKASDTMFETLRLSFRDGLINDMQLNDPIGQRTNILFQNVVLNEPVAADTFQFEVPDGVDVISE